MAKSSTRATPRQRPKLKKKKAPERRTEKTSKQSGKDRSSPGRGHALKAMRKKGTVDLLARAGGNATTAGVSFQASVGAVFAVQMLAETTMDHRLGLGGAKPCGVRFESEAAVDDCGIETNAGGWVFIQAKTGFSLSTKPSSELRKTAGQIVRLWHSASAGRGKKGWDRPLTLARDRFVIAAGPNSSGSVTRALARALETRRAKYSAPLPQDQTLALGVLVEALKAEWKTVTKLPARNSDIRTLLPFIVVIPFDMGGPDRAAAIAGAAHLVTRAASAANTFVAIEKHCQQLMEGRLGGDAAQFRTAISALGIPLKAPPSYEGDVTRLYRYSDETRRRLAEFEKTIVAGVDIRIPRDVTTSVVEAAKHGSFLVIGEPGAGKSAVISAAATLLRKQKYDVVELAVDQLTVDTADGMRLELGLEHRLIDVLENWPGRKPAFLVIDALDATRGGAGERVFRALIASVMKLPASRWRLIASIRSFDLRMGEQFRVLFNGPPPAATFASKDFADVRHICVPPWNDVEFAALRAQAPPLDNAIARGGDKLRDLARVPFNTRLLAELITNGATPDTFSSVASQVELLTLYWRKRVEQHGSGAELCLRTAVTEMVSNRSLRARRTTAAAASATAFDALLKDGVVTFLSDDRLIGFRHHILFDYAASRLFIDPLDIAVTVERLRNDRGLSLMLAPAIGFALQSLWGNGEPGHGAFWKAVCLFAGGAGVDPVARSIAARVASELPEHNYDMRGFLSLLQSSENRETARIAFSHVVGALIVRVDDSLAVQDGVWCYLAARISVDLEGLAWPLRTLLTRFSKRITDDVALADLGVASRALFSYAFDRSSAASLMPIAIELVADSYRSDHTASRALLSKTLTPERLASYAHEDIPALTRQAKTLLAVDPDFLTEIFGVVFGYSVSDDSPTAMGPSQILALTSNKRQDYDHAKWTLKEVVPHFLETNPELAIQAISGALEGYVRRKYGGVQTIEIQAAGGVIALIADHSHIWASDPDDRHAHADNAAAIILAFKKRLGTASEADARLLAQHVIRHAKPAVLWARMFLVGAKRASVLGTLLWPYAREIAFLRASETTKDALDLVAAVYPLIDEPSRKSFEENVFGIQYPDSVDPERSRLRFLGTLFRTIGAAHLATEQARQLVQEAAEKAISTDNHRSVQFTMTSHPVEPYYWLPKDVDIKTPSNAAMLRLIERMDAEAGDLSGGLTAAEALSSAINAAASASVAPRIKEHAEDQLSHAFEKMARQREALKQDVVGAERLWSLVSPYLRHARPADLPGKATDLGPRASSTEAALHLCAISQGMADTVFSEVAALTNDPSAAVRFTFAQNIGCLWELRRDDLWRIAEQYVAGESNSYVLHAITDFLCRAVHHDLERVEDLALQLMPRAGLEEDPQGDRIVEGLASIVAVLWTQYERPRANSLIAAWLVEPEKYEGEIRRVISTMRDHIVGGYISGKAADIKLRKNIQRLASEIVDGAAAFLDAYYSKGDSQASEPERERFRVCARLVDHVGDQLYFSSGASADQGQEVLLAGDESKRAFLRDMTPMMRRVGDVGVPHTIYYLVQLLDFLRPVDPEAVFDLIAHALLQGGARHGYQFESLATDLFAQIVGVYLADHRGIFADPDRREKLIACLDIFVEAGWPKARRLLYRLPELL
jgi:uncharacterized protein (DUF934 family)